MTLNLYYCKHPTMDNKKLQIKKLAEHDLLLFKKLIQLFHKVFEMENALTANEAYLKTLLPKRSFIVYAAVYENEVVGGLTAYELPMYYSEGSELYIYDIAVKSEFQRKGVGKQILLSLKEYCRQNGIKEMFVEAHEEDKHAVDFYHSSGGQAEKVVHFNFLVEGKG